MGFLKQSTTVILKMGPFVDSTDGVTAETGLTIAQADIQISKAGAAFAQTSDASPTTTHDADGWYPIPLTTTDTGTLGVIKIQVAATGAVPVWETHEVVSATYFDFVAGTANAQADVIAISGDTAAADNAESFFDGTGYAGTGNTIPTVTTLTGHTAQTGDSYARLGAPAGASVSADVAAVKVETNSLDGTKIPDTISLANINAQVVDTLDTDTLTLPGQEAPTNTPTMREALGWLYKTFRNKKEQTATTWSLYDDAGSTVDAKATVADDGTTASKAEIVVGP